jgi:hypothetical protein
MSLAPHATHLLDCENASSGPGERGVSSGCLSENVSDSGEMTVTALTRRSFVEQRAPHGPRPNTQDRNDCAFVDRLRPKGDPR